MNGPTSDPSPDNRPRMPADKGGKDDEKSTYRLPGSNEIKAAHEAAVEKMLAAERLAEASGAKLCEPFECRFFPRNEAVRKQINSEITDWYRSCPENIARAIQRDRLTMPLIQTSIQKDASQISYTVLHRVSGWPDGLIEAIVGALDKHCLGYEEHVDDLVLKGGMWNEGIIRKAFRKWNNRAEFDIKVRVYALPWELPSEIMGKLGFGEMARSREATFSTGDDLRPSNHTIVSRAWKSNRAE